MLRKSLPQPKGNTQLSGERPSGQFGPLGFLYTPSRPVPSDTGQPSMPVNDPFDALKYLKGTPENPVLSTVDPDTAISPGGDGERSLRHQGARHDLFQLRLKFPHLPIIPFPNSTRCVALPANNAVDINLPTHAILAMFKGNGDYYVSINGAASIPTNTASDESAQASASAFKPEGFLFYLANVNQVSLIAPQDTVVTILFFNGE